MQSVGFSNETNPEKMSTELNKLTHATDATNMHNMSLLDKPVSKAQSDAKVPLHKTWKPLPPPPPKKHGGKRNKKRTNKKRTNKKRTNKKRTNKKRTNKKRTNKKRKTSKK